MHARMNPTRPSNDAAMAGAVRARALLIIEDDPPIRRALRNALGEVAERLLEAPTGKTGIDIAATERPDLVILDLSPRSRGRGSVPRDPILVSGSDRGAL